MFKSIRNTLITTTALALTAPAFAQGTNPFATVDQRVPTPTATQVTPDTVTIQTIAATYDVNIKCDKGSLIMVERPFRFPNMAFAAGQDPQVTAIFFDPTTGKVNASATTYGTVEASPNLTLDELCDGQQTRGANEVLGALARTLAYRYN